MASPGMGKNNCSHVQLLRGQIILTIVQAVFTLLLSSSEKCLFLTVETSTVCYAELQLKSSWDAFAGKVQIENE